MEEDELEDIPNEKLSSLFKDVLLVEGVNLVKVTVEYSDTLEFSDEEFSNNESEEKQQTKNTNTSSEDKHNSRSNSLQSLAIPFTEDENDVLLHIDVHSTHPSYFKYKV